MKKVLVKAFITALLIIIITVVTNAFSTPYANSVAMLQLEDSNISYASYTLAKNGYLIKYILSSLVVVLMFWKEAKKLLKSNK